jgi:hypothetical protein
MSVLDGGNRRDELAQKLEHWVSDKPFDPNSIEAMTPEQERYFLGA